MTRLAAAGRRTLHARRLRGSSSKYLKRSYNAFIYRLTVAACRQKFYAVAAANRHTRIKRTVADIYRNIQIFIQSIKTQTSLFNITQNRYPVSSQHRIQ